MIFYETFSILTFEKSVDGSTTYYTYIKSTSLDLRVQFMLILIPEWRVTNQKNIQNDTCFEIFTIRTRLK